VASHFGLKCIRTLHYWFPAYNPEFSSYSPGRLLLKQIIQAGDQHGVSRIDRGTGDTPAKRDFATSQHAFYRGIWTRPSPQAMGYRLSLSVKWRLSRMMGATRRKSS
jgi:CelD/BcsL family acetyltransferase involved in cellulose biosynthesis